MKIEKGKFYRTRDGRKVEILKTDAKNPYPIIGMVTHRSYAHESCRHWSDNGTYLKSDKENSYDIIGEWEEALDFDPYCLPKWADKWIAMDADREWYCYSEKPAPDDHQIWCTDLGGKSPEIPLSFSPKNYKGDWKDSLFNVDKLKKDKSCQCK